MSKQWLVLQLEGSPGVGTGAWQGGEKLWGLGEIPTAGSLQALTTATEGAGLGRAEDSEAAQGKGTAHRSQPGTAWSVQKCHLGPEAEEGQSRRGQQARLVERQGNACSCVVLVVCKLWTVKTLAIPEKTCAHYCPACPKSAGNG